MKLFFKTIILTKVETATCIAISARLVSKSETLYTMANVKTRLDAKTALQAFSRVYFDLFVF